MDQKWLEKAIELIRKNRREIRHEKRERRKREESTTLLNELQNTTDTRTLKLPVINGKDSSISSSRKDELKLKYYLSMRKPLRRLIALLVMNIYHLRALDAKILNILNHSSQFHSLVHAAQCSKQENHVANFIYFILYDMSACKQSNLKLYFI